MSRDLVDRRRLVACKACDEATQEHEGFLQEMFPTVDVDLVRDVLHNVQGDSEKACNQLLVIQVTPCMFKYSGIMRAARHSMLTQLLSVLALSTHGWCC